MNEQIKELRARLESLSGQMDAIVQAADQGGGMSDEDAARFKQLSAEFERVNEEIKLRERNDSIKQFVAGGRGRQSEPEPLSPAVPTGPRLQPGNDAPGSPSALPAGLRGRQDGGFTGGFGQFLSAVLAAGLNRGGEIDSRLKHLAPTTYGSESNGPDGGFAVPPDFRKDIMARVYADDSLITLTDQLTTTGNSLTLPLDENNPWDAGGIKAYWRGEADAITQSKPALKDRTIKLGSLAVLVPLTDELLEDAPSMETYVRRKAPDAMKYKLNEAFLFGTGAGQPTGVVNAASSVTVSKESGQTADTVVYPNVKKMWSRLYGPCRKTSVWLYNQDTETQLFDLFLGMPSSSPVTGHPVFMPPGGISGSPYATLYGRPMMPLENCAALGDVGDIVLWDPKKYITLTKQGSAAVKQDTSVHIWFDQAVTAFRFIFRVGGEPWWTRAFSRAKAVNTLGSTVLLEDRT